MPDDETKRIGSFQASPRACLPHRTVFNRSWARAVCKGKSIGVNGLTFAPMSERTLPPLLELAIDAAVSAGEAILVIYESGDFQIETKGDDSPLTRADTASHHIIAAALSATGIPVLSEEGRDMDYAERAPWQALWIVDPIDGTKEFIKRNGEFTVNIALVKEGAPVLGVIYVPVSRTLYFADVEQGAWRVEVDADGKWNPDVAMVLPIPQGNRPFTVVASRSHLSPETETYINALRADHGEVELVSRGSSLKLCMVAEGAADCYPRFAPTMEWDTAAGQAICMAAGFDVIDQETGSTMRYNREDLLNPWFLVR
jgi:3'(2'), 5'-bisphosphate nucleotidase